MKNDKHTEKTPIYKRRKVIFGVIAIIVLILVVRGFQNRAVTPTESAQIEKGTVKEELVLSGEIRAVNHSKLAFGSSGTLSWVGVKLGDSVKKGQALAKIDTTILNSSYQQSLATLHSAEATVNRIHDDLKGKDSTETFVEKETRVAAETAHDKAYESMVAARKALFDATLVAPFDGIVASITNASAGMNITAGSSQIEVVDPNSVYFLVNADQTEVVRFRIGDKSEIVLDAIEGSALNGAISSISFTPSTEESGTVYPMRLSMPLDTTNYRIGLTGDAHFVLSQKDQVLAVPSKFVKSDKTGKYVLINKTEKKYVEVGIEGDEKTEIKTDLTEGTVVFN